MPAATEGPRAPAYRALADALRARIMAGELRPGDRLPVEPELCREYDVSRSTVREALRVLSSEHLLTTRRGVGGGSFVTAPDHAAISASLQSGLSRLAVSPSGSVDDLLEVRELLEVPAAGLAAQRRTDEQLVALRGTLFDPRDVQVENLFGANRNFHVVLLRAAANPLLETVTRPIFGVLNDRFLRAEAPSRFWHRVDRDHREILRHVEAGDAAGACEAQRAHLRHLRTTYTRIDRERASLTPKTSDV